MKYSSRYRARRAGAHPVGCESAIDVSTPGFQRALVLSTVQASSGATRFDAWLDVIRHSTQDYLAAFFEEKQSQAQAISRAGVDLVRAVADLTLRGGKRLRAALLSGAYRAACGGGADSTNILDAGASLEVLQTYLLIHDDWMDDDAERRGGTSAAS